MKQVEIKFTKTNSNAKIPTRNFNIDTGFDVYSVESKVVPARGSSVIDVGLAFAFITPGYWVKIEGRSGLGFKHGITPHPGIIDQGYRGTAGVKLYNNTDVEYTVQEGDRIAQFVVYKNYDVTMSEADAIEESDRGSNGFGSSGLYKD